MFGLAPQRDGFRLIFPKEFLCEPIEQKYSKILKEKHGYYIAPIDFINETIQKVQVLGFTNAVVPQNQIINGSSQPYIDMSKQKQAEFPFPSSEFSYRSNVPPIALTDKTLKRTKRNKYETQFYIGSILLMLDYLQKKYIAHRDIKPSNIMIDENGYLKMIDFGTAKVLKDYTSTIIGTPHYIAPEILQGKGYSLSCDFWSLGICMFEIFYGKYPFGDGAGEVIDIYKEVLKKNLSFPKDSSKFEVVNNFIEELLAKKVNERICNVSKLKKMEFFRDFDFDKLNDFQLEPPYKPEKYLKVKNPLENTKLLYENKFIDQKNGGISTPKRSRHVEENYDDSDYEPNWVEAF